MSRTPRSRSAGADITGAGASATVRAMLELNRDAVVVLDEEDRVRDCNAPATTLLGCAPGDAVGRPLASLVPESASAEVTRLCESARDGSAVRDATLPWRRDGAVDRAVGVTICAIPEGAHALVVAMRELETPARAGKVGAREMALLHTLIDTDRDAIIVYDTDLRVIEWPPVTARNNGLSREEAIGRSVLDLFPYIRGTAIEAEYRRALAGETVEGRERSWSAHPGEAPRWYDVSYIPIRDDDGRILGGAVMTRDVTTRREAEDALADERRLLRTIVDVSPHVLIAVSVDLTIREWNTCAERNTGMRRADVVGRHLLDVLPTLTGTEVLREYEAAVAGTGREVRGRWYPLPSGELRCYDVVFAALHDGRGTTTGAVMIAQDVTDRARAQEALTRERSLLRGIVDAVPSAIITFDRDFRVTEWNAESERNTGVARDRALGRPITDLMPPGFDAAEGTRRWTRVLGGEVVPRHHDRFDLPKRTGSTVMETVMVPLFDPDGSVTSGVIVAEDATDRLRFAGALAESEARYRQLFEESPVPQIVVDPGSGRIIDANVAAMTFYGYARTEIIGMEVARFSRGSELAVMENVDLLRRDGAVHFQRTHWSASGDARAVDVYARLIVRDEHPLIHAWIHDVTQRVLAEAERDRLVRVIEATSDIIATGDLRTNRVTYVNPAGRRLLDIADDDPMTDMHEFVVTEDAERFQTALLRALQDGVWRGELHLQSRRGRVVPASVVLISHADADGQSSFVSTVSRDISVERRHEQELTRARERAERASEAKSSMLAGLSHELRTPLGAVLGFAQLLQDGRAGPLTEEQGGYLDEVLQGAAFLLRVVNDALDLARVEAGAIDLRPEEVDPLGLASSVMQTVAPLAHGRGIETQLHVADDARRIWCDPARLRQILLNLLTNAAKYSHAGGRVFLDIVSEDEHNLRFTVRDEGPGIAAADMARLFVEFQRLGSHPDVPGSGLGLAITKRLAEAMGGSVSAESDIGRGTAFHVILPRGLLT